MNHHIAIIGSGPSGMTAALLLARQGHRITLVDRDPGPVAGQPWERVGVMQFHLPHSLRAPGRSLLAERLPDLHDAIVAAGGEVRGVPGMPPGMHVRRSVLERAMWEHTTAEPRVRRLVGHVDEAVVLGGRVRGVVVDGTFVPSDLVVDASGRAGRLAADHRPLAESAPAGIAYAARQYQLLPGAAPGPSNGGLGLISVHDGFMELVFTHDRGTFTVLLARATDDAELAELRYEQTFEAALATLPDSATWTDPSRSRPIDHVRAGAGLVNSYRGQATDVVGLLAVGDAAMITNPAGSRGLTLGMQGAAAVADIVAALPPEQWATALDAWGTTHLRPWFEEHVIADAWQRDTWAGVPTDPDGPIPWNLVVTAAVSHPEWMRVLGPFMAMATGPESIDPLREEVRAMLREGWQPKPPPGITRDDLVAAIRAVCVPA